MPVAPLSAPLQLSFFALPIKDEATPGRPMRETPLEGVQLIRRALTGTEQAELFNWIKPQMERQSFVENKAATANLMFHFGLRWGRHFGQWRTVVTDPFAGPTDAYGYADRDQRGQPLPTIPARIKELVGRASGVDLTHYDSLIGNIYFDKTFISEHRDTTESISAGGYPVVGVNLGGQGSFLVAGIALGVSSGDIYTFGGPARWSLRHRTGQGVGQDNALPTMLLPTGKNIGAEVGEPYRISLTFRRARALEAGMPAYAGGY